MRDLTHEEKRAIAAVWGGCDVDEMLYIGDDDEGDEYFEEPYGAKCFVTSDGRVFGEEE